LEKARVDDCHLGGERPGFGVVSLLLRLWLKP